MRKQRDNRIIYKDTGSKVQGTCLGCYIVIHAYANDMRRHIGDDTSTGMRPSRPNFGFLAQTVFCQAAGYINKVGIWDLVISYCSRDS